MRQTLRYFILFVALLTAHPLFSQQQTRTTNGPAIPGLPGYLTAQPQAPNGPSNPTPQNGNGTLGQIYNFTKCGLGFTQASQRLGQRFTPQGVPQPATFAISGIPACAVIEQAYLWTEGSGDGSAQTATIVNPASTSQNFPMALVGSGPDKCWGYAGSQTYRASVTPIISGNGNYTISGLFTSPPTSGNDMDGATLMIIYSDPTAAFRGSMVIHDGAVVINGGTTTQNVTGMSVCQNVAAANATAFCMVGDIQMTGQTCTMNGTNAPFAWNWWNYVQVNTALTTGQTTSAYTMTSGGDCFNLCVIGMYFRTTCTPCTSSSLTLTPSSTPATCSNCNGSASVSVTPAGPYTYSWAPSGGNAATATGLCAGTYTVTVSNACNTATMAVTVASAGGGLTVNSGGQTNVNCFGNCNGSATATVTGGTGPYTYAWLPSGGNAATATGLCAGTYTVNVTDANGCTGNRVFTITQPPVLANTFTQVNVLCNGGNTGSATVTASGGTPGYTFAWAPAVTNTTIGSSNTATGLTAGTYVCTITDLNGCTSTRTITITQPPVLANTFTQVNVLCNGNNTGSATITASGGTPGYTFAWSPAVANTTTGNTNTATGLGAGTYVCTITDLNGCTSTRTVIITQPTALTNSFTQVNLLCNGANTGSATVTASGGSPGYTFSWSPAVANTTSGNSNTATGLTAGTYVCTITDINGCTSTRTVTITQPPALANTFTQVNVLCNGGNTGSATVTASGGTPGYTFAWAPAVANTTSGSSNTATGLTAGTYVCTITDLNGCTSTRTITITQPPALTLTTSSTSTTCGNNNGSVTVSATGGTGTINYLWTPGNYTTATVNSLAAGTYVVTATDGNGCTATATVTVNSSSAIASTQSSVNVLCNGNSTGSATINVTGNNGTLTYVWVPNVSTTNTATNLAAGTYVVTATDATGCPTSQTIVITQPTALTNTFTQTNVLCNGGNTGSATVTASGGTPGYTFAWTPAVTNTTSGNSNTATGLTAGTYVCTITDLNGCITTNTITITEPTAIALSVSTVPSTCGNPNGSVTATASGGTGLLTYAWTPGNYTTASVNNLSAGPYTVVVTDANNCSATALATINNLGSPSVNVTAFTSVSCYNGSDGTATSLASGGTGPLSCTWSNGDSTWAIANLPAGTYVVTVTDANNCTDTASVTVLQPTQVTSAQATTSVSCFGGNNGTATVTGSGGTGAFTFNWNPAVTNTTTGNSNTATALAAGSYVCTVTDANNCAVTETVVITQPTALASLLTATDATCNAGCNGTLAATISGGTAGYTYNWSSGCTAANCSNVCAGTYTLTATDSLGCTITDSVSVNEPAAMSVQMQSTAAFCNQANGYVNAIGSGGTGNLSYVWNPGNLAQQSSNVIPPGNYTVTVTDQNNCWITDSVTVTNTPGVAVAGNPTSSVSCFNGNDGAASVTATGGTAPYTYAWTPNVSTTSAASSLAAGSYVVLVADSAGCTATVTVVVTQPVQLTTTATAGPAAVCAGQQITLTATPSGGTPGYTANWQPIGVNNLQTTYVPAASGTFTVTVTDLNGCTSTATTSVVVNPQPSPQFSGTPTQGCAPLCVNFTDLTGAGSWVWNWDFGDGNTGTGSGTPTNCYAQPGSYDVQLTVTDPATGCTGTITQTNFVTVFANPVAAFGSSPDNATMVNPVIFFSDSSTGAAAWNWSFGDLLNSASTDQNPSFAYPSPGCYQVTLTVTSADGCTDIATDSVCIGLEATLFVPNAFTPNGDGDNEIFLPLGIGIEPIDYHLYIFDRWGNLIFESDNPLVGWDGRANGGTNIAQEDVYVWRLKCVDVTGQKHNKLGTVTLIK
jgi:large repetitive protein